MSSEFEGSEEIKYGDIDTMEVWPTSPPLPSHPVLVVVTSLKLSRTECDAASHSKLGLLAWSKLLRVQHRKQMLA